jgi:hypothetical protein
LGTPLNCGALTCDIFAGCVVDNLITGKKIVLRADRDGTLSSVKVQTRGQISTSLPPAFGTATDPVLHGGALRLRFTGGFDKSFELPKGNWSYLRQPEDNRGFSYHDRDRGAPIRGVVVKDGKLTKVVGGGSEFQASLATDPSPVEVSLIIGNQRYCMAFGGVTKFDAGNRFSAEDAPAPGACPP